MSKKEEPGLLKKLDLKDEKCERNQALKKQSPSKPTLNDGTNFYKAWFEGTQISSTILPIPIIYQQFRKNNSSNLQDQKNGLVKVSYRDLMMRSIRLNGILSFGLGLTYASIVKSFDYYVEKNDRGSKASSNSTFKFIRDDLRLRINDYSIIGATLGGLTTLTIFYKNRSLFNIIGLIPGGISLGIGLGISTAFIKSN